MSTLQRSQKSSQEVIPQANLRQGVSIQQLREFLPSSVTFSWAHGKIKQPGFGGTTSLLTWILQEEGYECDEIPRR